MWVLLPFPLPRGCHRVQGVPVGALGTHDEGVTLGSSSMPVERSGAIRVLRPSILVMLVVIVGCAPQSETTSTITTAMEEATMRLTSPAFADGEAIPISFTCDGDDLSPPLEIAGIPDGTVSLVLVMDDPDAPRGTWDHWVAFDIPPVASIPEAVVELGQGGRNSWGRIGYGGPCPPSGTHRYVFTVHALAGTLGLDAGATKAEVLAAVGPLRLGSAVLTGTYRR